MIIYRLNTLNGKIIDSLQATDILLEPVRDFEKSFGLAPVKIILVKDDVLKEEFLSELDIPKKSKENTALVIFAVRTAITNEHINDFISGIQVAKKVRGTSLNSYKKYIKRFSSGDRIRWASRQADRAIAILADSAKRAGAGFIALNKTRAGLITDALDLENSGLTMHAAVLLKIPATPNLRASVPELHN